MVEQVGKLSELGLPGVKLSEKDEDCMHAISETNYKHTHGKSYSMLVP